MTSRSKRIVAFILPRPHRHRRDKRIGKPSISGGPPPSGMAKHLLGEEETPGRYHHKPEARDFS